MSKARDLINHLTEYDIKRKPRLDFEGAKDDALKLYKKVGRPLTSEEAGEILMAHGYLDDDLPDGLMDLATYVDIGGYENE